MALWHAENFELKDAERSPKQPQKQGFSDLLPKRESTEPEFIFPVVGHRN
jgi:hypothetical protein